MHPDRDYVKFILRGLGEGFHIGYQAPLSSLANHQVLENYIANEIAGDRMVGSRVGPLSDAVHCS